VRVITVDQIKTHLGITDTSQDAALTAILPAVDAKVKEVCSNRFNMQFKMQLDETVNARVISVVSDPFFDLETDKYRPTHSWSINKKWVLEDIHDYLFPGTEVSGDGIPDGAYITEVYSVRRTTGGKTYYAPSVELSAAATASGTVEAEAGFNKAYQPLVAKLAWWMVQDQSTDTPAGSVASESVGDISVSYSQAGANIDGRHGVPSWVIKGLPRYGRGY